MSSSLVDLYFSRRNEIWVTYGKKVFELSCLSDQTEVIHGYRTEKVVHRDTVRAVSCVSNHPMGEVIERIEEIIVSSVRLQNYSKLSRVNTRS